MFDFLNDWFPDSYERERRGKEKRKAHKLRRKLREKYRLKQKQYYCDVWEQKEQIKCEQREKEIHMFCSHCGKPVANEAVICIECGCYVQNKSEEAWETKEIVFLIIATLFMPIVGIVAGIYGLCVKGKEKQGGSLLAFGVLMSFVDFVFFVALIAAAS